METEAGEQYELLVKNISCHGLGGKFTGSKVKVGDRVIVKVPKLDLLHGTVQWLAGGAIGIRVEEEIDPNILLFESDPSSFVPPSAQPEPFRVAERFQPVRSIHRPGFGRK